MKIVKIKVTAKDPDHDRWWNKCVGRSYSAFERNGTVYEITSGEPSGFLINKSNCELVSPVKEVELEEA